jgi:predicted ABC-type transport system involved in lysophospholipase L1 biosynthesis ATPase subunit
LELNREQGATLVVVTHSRDLSRRFERQLEVRDGKLVGVGA